MASKLATGKFIQAHFDKEKKVYITPCVDCGELMETPKKWKSIKVRCPSCQGKSKKTQQEINKELAELKAIKRFETAKEEIIRQYGTIEGYEHAFETLEKKLFTPGWFQSINEVMTALELIRSKIRARHQVRKGKWRIDFLLPDLFVVLEIDGAHHNMFEVKHRDRLKEAAIIANLGPKWEFIRISDDLIRKNLKKLIPAINKAVETRQEYRTKRKGELPLYYTKQV